MELVNARRWFIFLQNATARKKIAAERGVPSKDSISICRFRLGDRNEPFAIYRDRKSASLSKIANRSYIQDAFFILESLL